tara:strand:+ start:334 stop:588 length:255 start_codon:yes stop_codon:yes gene_type:complete
MDNVNQPPHYNTGDIECIQAIQASMTTRQFQGYLKGNVIKYIWRYEYKNQQEDLQKAQWYLARLLQTYDYEGENHEDKSPPIQQ